MKYFTRFSKAFICVLVLPMLFVWATKKAETCTDFRLANSGDYSISGRTMDFDVDLESELVVVPRGQKKQSILPDGTKGIGWTSKYGFVGVNALGLRENFVDGLNEKGLSVATLWLRGTKYPGPVDDKKAKQISLLDAEAWILGNFSRVEEVKQALSEVDICAVYVEELKMIPPLHLAIHDAYGKNLVVEFINGETKFYDNPNQVLTNFPFFDWQTINLYNYPNITNKNATDEFLKKMGHGSGMLGLPGDTTSPSRFVRAYFLNRYSPEPKTIQEAVSHSLHIINAIEVADGQVASGEHTQWSLVRDHANKVLYFRDDQNQNLRAIDLTKLDLNPRAQIKSLPITAGSSWRYEVNGQLR